MIAYALIPARSGSKGLPDKNVKALGGHPLLAHACAFARKPGTGLANVFCSTDSQLYADIAMQYGALVPCLRSDYASSDTAMEEAILQDIAKRWPRRGIVMPDVWVWLKPTSPFRDVGSLARALAILDAQPTVSAVRIVTKADARLITADDYGMSRPWPAPWPTGRPKIRRTEMPPVYQPYNLEVFRHSNLKTYGGDFIGPFCKIVEAPAITGLDINDADDFEVCQALVQSDSDYVRAFTHLPRVITREA